MRQLICAILLIFTATLSLGQTILVSNLSFEEKQLSTFSTDQFNNLYIAQGNQLKKTDSQHKVIARYSNPINGDITSLDLLDPMYPLIFFNDFNRLTFLDNRLNERETVDLVNLGFIDPELVCNGGNNIFFIYDQAADKIQRFSKNENRNTNQTLNITQLLKAENTPTTIQADFEGVYLYTPEIGLVIFDNVLAYTKTIPVKSAIGFYKQKNSYYFLFANRIGVFTLSGEKIQDYFHDIKNPKNLRVKDKTSFLVQSENKIYTLQLPDSE